MEKKIKFEDYKSCLDATRLENEINYPKETKNDVDSLKKIIKNS